MNVIRYRATGILSSAQAMHAMVRGVRGVCIDDGINNTYIYMHSGDGGRSCTRYTLLIISKGSHCYFSSAGKVGKHPWRHL